MKKITFILLILSTNIVFAQQNQIVKLISKEYHYKHFNLKKSIKKLFMNTAYSLPMGYSSGYDRTYQFNNKGYVIELSTYDHSKKNAAKSLYKYDKKNRLIQIYETENDKPSFKYNIEYNKKGKPIKILMKSLTDDSNNVYIINWKKNKVVKYLAKDKDGKVIYESFNHLFDKQKNIIKFDFTEEGEKGVSQYVYNDKGLKTSESVVYENGYKDKTSYTHNNYNDVLTESGELSVENEYKKYDKYDHWTILYSKKMGMMFRTKRVITYF
jgi:hypothetical protein